jgi:aryl-alcohol dehydrogenase-like predicted oxidoreductase
VPREQVFLTTKFRPGRRDPERELGASLQRLGVDQVDLYLVHWPQGGPTRAWAGMERSARHGLTKAIGVSNFAVDELEALLAVATIAPAVNQVQFSPFQFRRALLDACRRNGIVLEAYSPLTHGRDLGRTPPSPKSPPAWAARQRRSCCAGRSSETSRRFPNLSTASGSSRTPRCSTSRSTTTTWARWTPSTAPVAPAAPANAPGGSRLAQAVRARQMHSDGHRLH